MHGRPRSLKTRPDDQNKRQKETYKLELYNKLLEEILKRKDNKVYDQGSLEKVATLLSINPDVYTLWNYRREAFLHLTTQESSSLVQGQQQMQQQQQQPSVKQQLSEIELKVSFAALMSNPKSYSAWHHRKWIVQNGDCSLDNELHKVTEFLRKDGRNFHGWNYRLFLVKLLNRSFEQEMDYSSQKINESFSNYSAWHYRTKLLPEVYFSRGYNNLNEVFQKEPPDLHNTIEVPKEAPVEALKEELQLVKQAMFTDPEDQSAWLYHRWLLSEILKSSQSAGAVIEVLQSQAETCEELLAVEPDSKWPLLTLAWIYQIQAHYEQNQDNVNSLSSLVEQVYEKLYVLDQMRRGFYSDAKENKACILKGTIF